MKGYVIADLEVHDPEGMSEYSKQVPSVVEAYGGRYLVRGGNVETREGDWTPNRFVVLEFDSPEQARAWYESDDYRDLKEQRLRCSRGSLVIAEGAQ